MYLGFVRQIRYYKIFKGQWIDVMTKQCKCNQKDCFHNLKLIDLGEKAIAVFFFFFHVEVNGTRNSSLYLSGSLMSGERDAESGLSRRQWRQKHSTG